MIGVRKHTVIDNDLEKRILIGLVTSDYILNKLAPHIKPEYFELSASKIVVQWITDYQRVYKKAPGKNLEAIYLREKSRLKPAENDELSLFLGVLSDEFAGEKGQINEDYLLDLTRNFLTKQTLTAGANKILDLVSQDRVDDAKIAATQLIQTSSKVRARAINPFTVEAIVDSFREIENPILKFEGKMGDLVGPWQRGYLIGIMAPMKRGKCLATGTLVPLPTGELKPIEQIIKDRDPEIITKDLNNKLVRSKVSKWYRNGVKPTYKVTTKTGREIILTDNDSLFSPDGWKLVSDLTTDDFVAVPKILDFFGPKTLPPEQVKILAYMLAEGGLENLGFTNTEQNIKEDFIQCITSMGDSVRWKKEDITGFISNKTRNHGKATETWTWLRSIGVKRHWRSHNKEIPSIIFSLSKQGIRKFLAVLFTCDGSIYKTKNQVEISYSSASKKLIYQVQNLLLRFGIFGKLHSTIVKGKTYYEISIRDSVNVRKFIVDIGFIFSKQEKALSLLPQINTGSDRGFLDVLPPQEVLKLRNCIVGKHPREWWLQKPLTCLDQSIRTKKHKPYNININTAKKISRIIGSSQASRIVDSDILWDKITNIEYHGNLPTFDLSVPDTHNFVANDIIVHNTTYAINFGMSALFQGRKVFYASFEQPGDQLTHNIFRQLTATGPEEGEYKYPIFDCLLNQVNECRNKRRTCFVPKPEDFENPGGYKACTVCRGTKEFIPSTWSTMERRGKISLKNFIKSSRQHNTMYGSSLCRVIGFPAFTANMSDVEEAIYEEEVTSRFIPDVIIIDYPDIAGDEKEVESKREAINQTWMAGKRMAQIRKAVVIFPTQSSRKSFKKISIEEDDTPEDIRKLAHVDAMITLNQTDEEKKMGIMRIGVLVHRWREFDRTKQIMVLQQMALGQPFLDVESYIPPKKKEKEERNEDEK